MVAKICFSFRKTLSYITHHSDTQQYRRHFIQNIDTSVCHIHMMHYVRKRMSDKMRRKNGAREGTAAQLHCLLSKSYF